MKRVPPEVDRLMWAVAEDPKPHALDEFGSRYPEYRMELLRRVDMVRGLRQEVNATTGIKKHEIPRFEAKPIRASGLPKGMPVAIGFACAAVAFAGFTAFNGVARTPRPKVADSVVLDPPVFHDSAIQYRTPPQVRNTPSIQPPQITPPPTAVTPAPLALEAKRRDMDVKDVSLLDALTLITSGTRVKLTVAPGFVNQKVSLSFHQQTTEEMLFAMGKEYAFTVSDEGDSHFLLLPVPDGGVGSTSGENPKRRVSP